MSTVRKYALNELRTINYINNSHVFFINPIETLNYGDTF